MFPHIHCPRCEGCMEPEVLIELGPIVCGLFDCGDCGLSTPFQLVIKGPIQ